ncbi:MAG: hypothetical protein JSU94_10110 [Phycisphaerales bacterium]|nr:MAG: hypothetical protein JSU94_10110 [Phycisphaerales bacterium]
MRIGTLANLFCLACIVPMGGTVARAARTSSLSVEDVLAGIRMRDELLNSTHVVFKYQVYANHSVDPRRPSFSNLPLVRSRDVDIKRLWRKMRVEERIHGFEGAGTYLHHLDIFAWDGKKTTGYVSPPWNPDMKPTGSVKPRMGGQFLASYWLTPLEQAVLDIRAPLVEILDKAQWRLSGPETIGEYTTYRIDSIGLGNFILKVWLDPTRDFAPIQIDLTLTFEDGINIVERMTDVRLEQKDGVWVVADAVLRFHGPRHKNPRAREFYTRFSVTDYEVGVELSDDIFQIEFPEGVRVYDEILKTGYVVGEGVYVADENGYAEFVRTDPQDYISEMQARGAPGAGPNNSGPIPKPAQPLVPDTRPGPAATSGPNVLAETPPAKRRWPIIAAALTLACVLLAAGVMIGRHKW